MTATPRSFSYFLLLLFLFLISRSRHIDTHCFFREKWSLFFRCANRLADGTMVGQANPTLDFLIALPNFDFIFLKWKM